MSTPPTPQKKPSIVVHYYCPDMAGQFEGSDGKRNEGR